MSCPTPNSLVQHIIEHEILGIGNNPSSGSDITIIDGYPTFVDTSRGNKILSINRSVFTATKKDKAKDIYLRANNSVATSKTAYRMIHAGTITGISFQCSSSSNCQLHIYKNNLVTPLLTLNISGLGAHSFAANADFSESDIIQFYVEGSTSNPIAYIEVAWRF